MPEKRNDSYHLKGILRENNYNKEVEGNKPAKFNTHLSLQHMLLLHRPIFLIAGKKLQQNLT